VKLSLERPVQVKVLFGVTAKKKFGPNRFFGCIAYAFS
jgi:hypothetical protein